MPPKGSKLSEDHKRKLSEANKGKHHSEEAKAKMRNRVISEETRKKMCENHTDQSGDKHPFYGKHHSEETKKKMSEAHKGSNSGEKHPNFGKHLSEETRRKLSMTHKGENNPRWDPNLTAEERQHNRKYPAYYEWRKAVYEGDDYTCQKCGSKRSGTLNAHHIEGYSYNKELQVVVENGITFCKKCHEDFHRQYGAESTAEKVKEFIYEKEK